MSWCDEWLDKFLDVDHDGKDGFYLSMTARDYADFRKAFRERMDIESRAEVLKTRVMGSMCGFQVRTIRGGQIGSVDLLSPSGEPVSRISFLSGSLFFGEFRISFDPGHAGECRSCLMRYVLGS